MADKTYDANQSDQIGEDEENQAPESAAKSTSDSRAAQDGASVEHGGVTPVPLEAKSKDNEAEEDEELHDFNVDGPKDFDHPAAVETQRVIWVPNDELGLGRSEVEDMERRGIEGSLEKAEMNEKGEVKITGPPPGGPEINVE